MQMLVFELTRIESSHSYYTTGFFNGLLAKLMVACVTFVSVLDDCLSVGRGELLAARQILGISVSGRVRYISQFLHKGSHDCQLLRRLILAIVVCLLLAKLVVGRSCRFETDICLLPIFVCYLFEIPLIYEHLVIYEG
jgi:hypothetical protein